MNVEVPRYAFHFGQSLLSFDLLTLFDFTRFGLTSWHQCPVHSLYTSSDPFNWMRLILGSIIHHQTFLLWPSLPIRLNKQTTNIKSGYHQKWHHSHSSNYWAWWLLCCKPTNHTLSLMSRPHHIWSKIVEICILTIEAGLWIDFQSENIFYS